ncbi:MAG: hypothetical protein WCP45_04710 [Verrucomicrobiota bacterium]
MKNLLFRILSLLLAACAAAPAQTASYTNFIRQVQLPSGVRWDATVAQSGTSLSMLGVDTGGSRFELYTVDSATLDSYLLASAYVGTYVPKATVAIRSQDPYGPIVRTRADRPFYVDVSVSGLLSGTTDPVSSKSVKLLRYVQSYGVGGTGVGIDRSLATLLSQASITKNGLQNLTYSLTSIPGSDRTKVCGEERFAVYSVADSLVAATQIASSYIQVWPVASGSLTGMAQGQLIRLTLPVITVTLNDLYPNSTTYVQVYHSDPALGVTGNVVPGSALVVNDAIPQSRVLTLEGYDALFDNDGRWTMEIVTVTPFGTDRLAYVSFDIEKVINVNGTFGSIE